MPRVLPFVALLAVAPALSAAPLTITSIDWAQPRHGATLVRQPALAAAVGQLIEQPGSRLELHYPGGDEGSLWVHELRAWLVSLGVSSAEIDLVPGSPSPDRIELRVVPPANRLPNNQSKEPAQ